MASIEELEARMAKVETDIQLDKELQEVKRKV
jgi:hypothetical protein